MFLPATAHGPARDVLGPIIPLDAAGGKILRRVLALRPVPAPGPFHQGPAGAAAVSLGVLAAAWAVYDLLWSSPLRRHELAGGLASLVLLAGLAWGLTLLFSGRGAYIQVGATLGTIMAANVWVRILPTMRRAVEAAAAGRGLGEEVLEGVAQGAQRSKHNTFMAFSVVFLTISNHYPVTSYGHRLNWAILAAFVLVGLAARWLVNRHEARRPGSEG